MAKTATRTAAKPAAKPAARTANTATKAERAAQAQGRPVPEPQPNPNPGRGSGPQTHPRASLPAQAQAAVPASVSSSLPAFMRGDIDAGKQDIKQEDMEVPRLKLIQGLSPELQEFDDLRAGYFFHPASEMIFDEPFRAVVIYMDRRYILWQPRENGGGILARADDGIHWSPAQGVFSVTLDKKDGGAQVTWRLAPTVQQSGLANWGTMNPADPNSPPAATLMYNYLLAFPDHPELMPAIMTFQRSAIRAARRFNTKIRTVRTPLFGSIWQFSSAVETNNRGQDFYVPNVTGAGLVEDEGLYNMYKSMHAQFSTSGLNIKDVEGLQSDGESLGDNDNAADDSGAQGGAHNRF